MFLDFIAQQLKKLLANKFTLIGLTFLLVSTITKPAQQAVFQGPETQLHDIIANQSIRELLRVLNQPHVDQTINVMHKNRAGQTPLQALTKRARSTDFALRPTSRSYSPIIRDLFIKSYASLIGSGAVMDGDSADFITEVLPELTPKIIIYRPTTKNLFQESFRKYYPEEAWGWLEEEVANIRKKETPKLLQEEKMRKLGLGIGLKHT